MCGMDTFHEAVKTKGLSAIAAACKVTPQAVHKWLKKGVPAERVLDVESVTGVSRHELRPDIFGPSSATPPTRAQAGA